jgi:hypothetical protein
MSIIDHTKKHIFIWVPGTGGHEPHPAFVDAVQMICGRDAQILHVEYPAEWNMEKSVKAGVKAMKEFIEEISCQIDYNTQQICIGGSSQGAWVISEAYKDPKVRAFAHKTVLFGHPGVADKHDHKFEEDDSILEINNHDDAVTFGWEEDRKEMVKNFSRAQRGNIKAILSVLWLAMCHPVRLVRFMYLIAIHAGIITWNTSPHDYSQEMPLAVYWLTH